eukprot:333557_1
MSELISYKADTICLQEVDGGNIYTSFIEPILIIAGYDGYYSNNASCQREGCAMFWLRDIFDVEMKERDLRSFSIRDLFELKSDKIGKGIDSNLVEKSTISYVSNNSEKSLSHWESMDDINDLLHNHDELRKVTMEKVGQVVQIATLQLKESVATTCRIQNKPGQIVVANTHLFYHPMA